MSELQIPDAWVAKQKLCALQVYLQQFPEQRTAERLKEAEELQKMAYPQRPRALRKKLAQELRFK